MDVADPVSRLAGDFATYGDLVHDQVGWRLRAAGSMPGTNEVADLVRDTFMVAFAAPVRPPARLVRAWLLALARNECLRVLARPGRMRRPAAAPMQPAVDLAGAALSCTGPHPGGGLPERDLRTMVRWAADGLGPREREMLELGLRHGLAGDEVGRVMGLAPEAAARELERLSASFTRVLGTLLLARSAVGSCVRLGDMTLRWTGLPDPERRRRFLRHADGCETCCRERVRRVDPVAVLRLAPLVRAPRSVEHWVLGDATDGSVAAERSALAARAAPFDPDGFPVPLDAALPRGRKRA